MNTLLYLIKLKDAGVSTVSRLIVLPAISLEPGIISSDLRRLTGGSINSLQTLSNNLVKLGLVWVGYTEQVARLTPQRRHYLTDKGLALQIIIEEDGE